MKNKTIIYVPNGAKINIDTNAMSAPLVQYEERKRVLNIDKVKKVTGGKYGRSDRSNNA